MQPRRAGLCRSLRWLVLLVAACAPRWAHDPVPPRAASERVTTARMLPAGERLVAQLDDAVGTEHARRGDSFSARVVAPTGLLPPEARIAGEVVVSERGQLEVSPRLVLRTHSVDWKGCRAKLRGRVTSQETDPVSRPPSAISSGAAAAGGLVGALLFGIQGAAGGAGAGLMIGTVDDASHAERVDALLKRGALITVQLDAPLDLRSCPQRTIRSTESSWPM